MNTLSKMPQFAFTSDISTLTQEQGLGLVIMLILVDAGKDGAETGVS